MSAYGRSIAILFVCHALECRLRIDILCTGGKHSGGDYWELVSLRRVDDPYFFNVYLICSPSNRPKSLDSQSSMKFPAHEGGDMQKFTVHFTFTFIPLSMNTRHGKANYLPGDRGRCRHLQDTNGEHCMLNKITFFDTAFSEAKSSDCNIAIGGTLHAANSNIRGMS